MASKSELEKRIFITGGSGYIGSTIIELAMKDGYSIYALSGSKNSDVKLKGIGACPVRGDLKSFDVLRENAKADIAVHLADFHD
ncbi:hypothetical protein V1511DRAFT_58356 [Dipodascopsis uninucleata]